MVFFDRSEAFLCHELVSVNYYLRGEGFDDTQSYMRPPPRLLVAARLLLGQTQTEVAADSGISAKSIFKAENGTAGIVSVEKLMRHYAAKGVSFIEPGSKQGWGIQTDFLQNDYDTESATLGQ
ncbi:helix-turn-helix domain-containing protein [Rhizobium laguerreae]|uniref:helix-turn-helix domain-containing protein n=1 Tax=Rhizobium laguerreae TaxID=1076926 RepID=UPI001C90024B|nr:helix-turn-helix domain-containing protein [Rhizobium laguerreae]MBY3568658.1 helix-turn-helix transcriptional regulator [Rhizobium laguerreae]